VSVSIPIFYGDVPMSVRASMLFPADPEKARVLVGWAIAREPQASANRGRDEVLAIARDAAAFAKMTKEVGEREYAGQAAGEVVKALFLMIAHEPHRADASLEWAMQAVDKVVDKSGGDHRTRLHEYLRLLRPALHLWVIRRLDESWPRTRDEADALIERGEIVRVQLTAWNQGRRQPSQHLQGEFIAPYEGWRPQGLRFYPPRLASATAKKSKGRPRKPIHTGRG
jgi:hypothetical protein